MQGLSQHPRCKVSDGASLSLYQRENDGARWIYRYAIHPHRREIDLGALRLGLQKSL